MKRKILAGVLSVGFVLSGTAVADKSAKITKTLNLTDFDQIEMAGVYDLDLEVGGDYSITLYGPAEEVERVQATVRDGVLNLSPRERTRRRWGRNRHGIDVTITLPRLTGVEISGVVDGDIKNVDADRFEIEISGVGDVEIDGTCGSLDAEVSGVGELDARALECREVEIDVSGVGDASVYASESVDASASGVGDIDVYGSPANVRKNDSLFAEIKVR